MATNTSNDNKVGRERVTVSGRRETTETKPAFKTTELIVYVLAVLGVLIASAMVDENEDGQGFGAESAWKYVTWLTIGYMVARGLAKAGSYERDNDPRT